MLERSQPTIILIWIINIAFRLRISSVNHWCIIIILYIIIVNNNNNNNNNRTTRSRWSLSRYDTGLNSINSNYNIILYRGSGIVYGLSGNHVGGHESVDAGKGYREFKFSAAAAEVLPRRDECSSVTEITTRVGRPKNLHPPPLQVHV